MGVTANAIIIIITILKLQGFPRVPSFDASLLNKATRYFYYLKKIDLDNFQTQLVEWNKLPGAVTSASALEFFQIPLP